MTTDYEDYPKMGLYQHFHGSYYFLCGLIRDSNVLGKYQCDYFNVLQPELGHYVRPEEEWFTDVSDRVDNMTGQIHRFERVASIDLSVDNFTTEQLLKELSKRKDSPLQDIDYEGLNKCVAAVDYVVGQECEATKDEPKGVFVEASFSSEEKARQHLTRFCNIEKSRVFKRTFLMVD